MSKEFSFRLNIDDTEKEFSKIDAYDILYADSFIQFDTKEKIYSCYCSKCDIKKDLLLKDLVIFIDDHEELFSVNNKFYFFKCKKDM